MNSSPLVRLPIELHREIIDRLDIKDRVALRRTNNHFRAIVKLIHADYLAAESDPYIISRSLYACRHCTLQRLTRFTDDMRKGERRRHGMDAATRCCVRCGVVHNVYKPGTEVKILGQPRIICRKYNPLANPNQDWACDCCLPVLSSSQSGRQLRLRNEDLREEDWASQGIPDEVLNGRQTL